MRNPKSLPAPFPAKIYTAKTVLESIQKCIKEMKDNWKKSPANQAPTIQLPPTLDMKAFSRHC